MILMNYFIQALGASLMAFPLIWFLAGRRQFVGGRERVKVLIAGIVLTAFLCSGLRYASELLFGYFVFAKTGAGLNAVFFLGAPLSFAFVVARLMRPLNPIPRAYQSSPSDEPGQGGSEASQDLPIRR